MAAGQGFKTFTTGEVLTAADVNGYLMQGVNVFANATERDAEITSPQEGQFAYLKDTNVTTYYTGSAWANLDTTGMTNPMTTTGDTIYSSSGSTPARLGIGTSGQVLTVAGGVPTWASAPSGSMTLLSTTTLSGASTVISSISQSYRNLVVQVYGVLTTVFGSKIEMRINNVNNDQTTIHMYTTTVSSNASSFVRLSAGQLITNSGGANGWNITINEYAATNQRKTFEYHGSFTDNGSTIRPTMGGGSTQNTTAISSLGFYSPDTDFAGGTVLIYGVN
jgi:hypothetical protein